MPTASQTRHPRRATLRTVLQTVIALCALLPFVAGEVLVEFPQLAPYFVVPLAVAAIVARVMALPQVEAFLERHVPWLAAEPPPPRGDADGIGA